MTIHCIIPSAGNGSRFRELGKSYPKALLPVDNKPIIQHNIELLYDSVDKFTIVVKKEFFDMYEQILGMFPTFDKVNLLPLTYFDKVGPLCSIYNGVESGFDSTIIVLSDIILEEIPNLTYKLVSYQITQDFQRWCVIDDSDEFQLKYIDKPTERPYEGDIKSLNGFYHLDSESISKIKSVVFKSNSEEVQISEWLSTLSNIKAVELAVRDFGTIEEYKTMSQMKTRWFNSLSVEDSIITKRSVDPNKVCREFFWLENIPDSIKKYVVRPYGLLADRTGYTMEHLKNTTLRELITLVGYEDIEVVMRNLLSFSTECKSYKSSGFFDELVSKTKLRNSGEQLNTVLDILYKHEETIKNNCSIYHGDPVASNVLVDLSTADIKLIDPNGDLHGSWLYDLAKMTQSFCSDYDFIDSGLYSSRYIYSKSLLPVSKKWLNLLREKLSEKELACVLDLCSVLLYNLIPLHKDSPENQSMYLAQAKQIKGRINDLLF
jgi:CTP:phosphocholine cytidylyltransferase-like protein